MYASNHVFGKEKEDCNYIGERTRNQVDVAIKAGEIIIESEDHSEFLSSEK